MTVLQRAMRWDDLRTFLAITHHGTIAAAAKALEVNLTTVYRRLEALEETLGARLFDRHNKGYALTQVGRDVLDHASRVEEEVLALQRTVSGHDQQATGTVIITMPESLLALVGPLLLDFRAAFPRIDVELELHDRMFDLDRREADVALRPSLNPPEQAVGRPLGQVAWTTYARRGASAAQLPWVRYTETLADLAAAKWRSRQHRDEPVALAVSTVTAMAAMLGRGGLQGMLPCFVGDAQPALQRLHPPPSETASALWLLIHADLRRNARVRAFVDFAYPRLKALAPYWQGRCEQLPPE